MEVKPLFDIVLIARNESKTLPRLVKSLAEFQERGGMIYVLDTGSTDNTAEIARSLGCTVEEVGDRFRQVIKEQEAKDINDRFVVAGESPVVHAGEALFDFAAARNYAATLATQDMIATPDCDEIYTKFDIDGINKAIKGGATQLEYNFVFSHDPFGNPIISFRHCKFYSRSLLKWVGVVHEVLRGEANRVFLDNDVIRLEHWQNHETNRSGYLKGLAVDCFQNPDNDRNSHYFAREMYYTGRWRSAIKEFERHIAMDRWPAERCQSMVYMGECYAAIGQDDKALECYHKAFAIDSGRRIPFIRLAEHYFKKNDFQRTAAYAAAALQIPRSFFYSDFQDHYENTPHEYLYISLWWLGRREESKYHFDQALAYRPNNPKYLSDKQFYYPDLVVELTNKIKKGENFSFVKRGDGEEACIAGEVGENCDHHPYSKELGHKLRGSFLFLSACKEVTVVQFADQRNFNALLHRTDSDLNKVRDFWMAVANSPKRKVLVAPARLSSVGKVLHTNVQIIVPEVNAFADFEHIRTKIQAENKDDTIFIFCAGMPSKVWIADLLMTSRKITCIDAGSAFDPILGQTRTFQISAEVMNKLYYLPKVSIIIPHIQGTREEGLKRILTSIDALDYPKYLVEVILEEGEGTVPEKVKRALQKATGTYIAYLADDTEMEPDSLSIAVRDSLQTGKGLVAFDTGVRNEQGFINEHFLIRKSLLDVIGGDIFDTDFTHVGCDDLLWWKCKKINEAMISTAKVKHYHYSRVGSGIPKDEVNEIASKASEKDRALLAEKLSVLNMV